MVRASVLVLKTQELKKLAHYIAGCTVRYGKATQCWYFMACYGTRDWLTTDEVHNGAKNSTKSPKSSNAPKVQS